MSNTPKPQDNTVEDTKVNKRRITMNNQDAVKLKTTISEIILQRLADSLDMTVGEYGSVYDSEEHEKMLNRIMRVVLATHNKKENK